MAVRPLTEPTTSLRTRLPRAVHEHEVLRTMGLLCGSDFNSAQQGAYKQALAWAQRRAGGRLPDAAWSSRGFEYFAGGRTTLGVHLQIVEGSLWGLRVDDPDKNVPGRIWTTEIVVGRMLEGRPRLGIRLLVNTAEDSLEIEPHVPGCLQQIAERVGLLVDGRNATSAPWTIDSDNDFKEFLELLQNKRRTLPIILASGDERAERNDQPLIDTNNLSKATLTLAHVVVLPARFTYLLSDAVGRPRSVYHGGVRIYRTGFDTTSDPFAHTLYLGERVKENSIGLCNTLRVFAARESLKRIRLGSDLPTFLSIRSETLRIEQERRAREGASEADQLEAAKLRITALEQETASLRDSEQLYRNFHDEAEARATTAESWVAGATFRIRHLEEWLAANPERPAPATALPTQWDELAEWCDQNLFGRLLLAPAARHEIKRAAFEDVGQTARCLLWLADTCRTRRMEGGGRLEDFPVEEGVRNSPCGEDAFKFDYRGDRLDADWHIKSGGNTRDPARCLRIYYAWDENLQQVVVAHMPSHRRTGAS